MQQQANALLGLLAQTSVHAGAGSSAGVIDLPIQREAHTGWPCIFGSAVKGALRTRAENALGRNNEGVYAIFGPTTGNAADHAGALSVGDARLALLPVRSLSSAFKWVTCPAVLARLQRDASLLGHGLNFPIPDVPDENTAISPSYEGMLFLEEYRFAVNKTDLDALTSALAQLMQRADAKAALDRQLIVVGDDMFSHLAGHALPVAAHIALKDDDSKTVQDGALWYEETLPPDTLLYVPLMAQASRRQNTTMEAGAVLDALLGLFKQHPWLQVGGNETVGMGWCAIKIL